MNFTCPHCGVPQVLSNASFSKSVCYLDFGASKEVKDWPDAAAISVNATAARCANAECNQATIGIELARAGAGGNYFYQLPDSGFHSFRAYPNNYGKPFPASVPAPLLNDYNEAWAIVSLSPKSSATLARRCLQAMIRDFCNIKERTLFNEIRTLEQKLEADELPKGVDAETVEAMKALKDVGNIGAHMTEVEGIIVDVEPGEAEALLGLIEMLFTDWYVARDKRQRRLAEIQAIAAAKKAAPEPSPGQA